MATRPSRRRTMMELPKIESSEPPLPSAKKSLSKKSPTKKSPTRKSPGRPQKKSPARRSPARKSPARKKKEVAALEETQKLRTPVITIEKLKEFEEVVPRTLRPRARVAPSFSSIDHLDSDDIPLSSRILSRAVTAEQKNEEERNRKSLSRDPTPAVFPSGLPLEKERTPSVRSYSREVSVSRSSPTTTITLPNEFGGLIGITLLIPIMPLFVLIAHISLTNVWNERKPIDWLPWLWSQVDPTVIGTYFGFALLQLLITALPLGKLVDGLPDKYGRWRYRCNGIIAVILTSAAFGIAWTWKWTSLLKKIASPSGFISLIIGAVLWAFIMSIILLIKSFYSPVSLLNPAAITRSKFYNFFMGCQLCPRVANCIDIKFALQRISILGLICINVILLLEVLTKEADIHKFYPFFLCVGLQFFYALDLLWFEDQFATSFTAMYEGGGYLLSMSSALYPFIPTLMTRYLSQTRLEYPTYSLCAIAIIYCFGYIIYRGSNAQKNEFRKNPMNPSLAHLEVIPTTRGKKLLVTGWWGWLRHPNYLGDIIIQWSWLLTCGFHSPIPFLAPVITMLALVYRAYRDNSRCCHRYGAAWSRYCSRVPYRVFPGIY